MQFSGKGRVQVQRAVSAKALRQKPSWWAPWEYRAGNRAGELDTRPMRKGGEWPEKVISTCGHDEGCGLYSEPGRRPLSRGL